MEIFEHIIEVLTTLFAVCALYKYLYLVIGFFVKPKVFKKAPAKKKYAVIIAARNERLVIGKLLESINAQSYPKELTTVFVVADNCTDNTAEIARSHGAVVYERHEPERARKGWALEFLFDRIQEDYGIESFNGFLFFDADNVVNSDYIEQMNNAFSTGVDAVVGYRNSKNFSQNYVSAAYGIHFMRSTVAYHRPRSRLGLSTHIAGTGYLLSSDLLKDGWHFGLLTEDTQATLAFVCKGKKIEYCEAAELFDEQPTTLHTMARQRLRWAKGRLACFFVNVGSLIKGIFTAKGRRFSCYDMLFYIMPNTLVNTTLTVLAAVPSAWLIIKGVSASGIEYLKPQGSLTDTLKTIAVSVLVAYVGYVLKNTIIVVREFRHINCSVPKLIFYLLASPWFAITDVPITLASLFMRIKWKPIKHDAVVDIKDIKTAK